MGTKMAPSYANLFMGSLEPKLISKGTPHINMWRRYIDDIFIIWTGSNKDLEEFMTKINSVHPTIKFTHEADDNELTFLDMTVYKGPNFSNTGILDIKTHIKKTNKQLYIHKMSYHPEPCKKAIAIGETTRYLRTNSQQQTFKEMTKKLTEKLVQRGYRASETKNSIRNLKFENKQFLLQNSKQKDTPLVVLPVKFNDNCGELQQIVNKHWHTIESDPTLKTIFESKPLIAKKKNQSLANILVKAKITNPISIPQPDLNSRPHRTDPKPSVTTHIPTLFPKAYSMAKCKQRKCAICPRLRICKTIFNRKCENQLPNPQIQTPSHLPRQMCGLCNQMCRTS